MTLYSIDTGWYYDYCPWSTFWSPTKIIHSTSISDIRVGIKYLNTKYLLKWDYITTKTTLIPSWPRYVPRENATALCAAPWQENTKTSIRRFPATPPSLGVCVMVRHGIRYSAQAWGYGKWNSKEIDRNTMVWVKHQTPPTCVWVKRSKLTPINPSACMSDAQPHPGCDVLWLLFISIWAVGLSPVFLCNPSTHDSDSEQLAKYLEVRVPNEAPTDDWQKRYGHLAPLCSISRMLRHKHTRNELFIHDVRREGQLRSHSHCRNHHNFRSGRQGSFRIWNVR